MNKAKHTIENCLNYIEENLKNNFSLEDISKDIGISKFYLHRLFKSLTGENLMNYVTMRKVSSSIDELVNSNLRIIDIAVEYGFDHEETYIRSFKRTFGKTPLKVRKSREAISVVEMININEILSAGDAITYKPFFMVKPAFHITGKNHEIPLTGSDFAANDYAKEFLTREKKLISNCLQDNIYIGYTDWRNAKKGYTEYIPSVITDEIKNPPSEMVCLTILAHKYVVFLFVGFFNVEELNATHLIPILEYMFTKWVHKAGYEFADTFRFEYIDGNISNSSYCEIDLYQPIKKVDLNNNI